MTRRNLRGQLALSMAMIAIAMLFLCFAAFSLCYSLLTSYEVVTVSEDMSFITGWDAVILAGLCLVGLVLSVLVAIGTARRIVTPLHAVARAARRIESGDLQARAEPGTSGHGETAMLIKDFNAMAGRLERMAEDVIVWNAQIAHELRTPLTILKGRLQGVSEGVFVADETLISRLLAQVEGLQRLVEDLRVVSLVDSGQLHLACSEVEVAQELADMSDLVRPGLAEAGFTLDMVAEPGRAYLDMTRVRQALLALIDNARNHADPCTLKLELVLGVDDVEFRVGDQGPGLPLDFAEEAFKPFSRPRWQGNPVHPGSGLGLSVVRAIATAHAGTVRYEVNQGQHLFIINLPRNSRTGRTVI